MGNVSTLKLFDKINGEITTPNLLGYRLFSLCSLEDYENLRGTPTFGYLLNSGEYPSVKRIFDLFWAFLDEEQINKVYRISLGDTTAENLGYCVEIVKRKDCQECQSILMILQKNENNHPVQVKFVDIWRDRQMELPDDIGIVEIEDYYLNMDTRSEHSDDGTAELESYHMVNNLVSGLIAGDFRLEKR